MRTADCNARSGIAGDRTAAALTDAGADARELSGARRRAAKAKRESHEARRRLPQRVKP